MVDLLSGGTLVVVGLLMILFWPIVAIVIIRRLGKINDSIRSFHDALATHISQTEHNETDQ